jgi:hypothetical protein
VPPAFTSIVIGDSGLSSTGKPSTYITDSTKNWATNQWVNWGLRIGWLGTPSSVDSSTTYNNVRTITSNISNTIYFPALSGTFTLSGYTTYSIEYYAGTGTKSGNTVTDSTKHFTTNNPYLPSPYLVGYVVVITNDIGTNVAKGTVTSCTDTSFTVGSWTNLPNTCNGGGSIPSDGTVGYYFSATGHTMMCSDCHSNDTISSTGAQGPHGSGVKWMLKGRNRAWPTTLATDNGTGSVGTGANLFGAYTANYPPLPSVVHRATNDGTVNGLFCLNCHSIVSFTKEGSGRHSTGNGVSCTLYSHTENPHELHSFACVNCHIMVPHGGKMSRLIGDGSSSDHMPVRYAFNNTLSNMYVYNFTKEADPGIYSGNDCYVDSVHCGNYHTGGSEAW